MKVWKSLENSAILLTGKFFFHPGYTINIEYNERGFNELK